MDYGEKSKRQRKYMQSYFQKGRLPDYYPVQVREAHHLLNDLLDDPEEYRIHIRRYVVHTSLVGYKVLMLSMDLV